ncbi:MAG: hypothetical protein ACRKGH_06905 [Dehalogenimonas sp.]
MNNPIEIIDLMARNEILISDLYLTYAELFPKLGGFWADLADDEKHHAEWLKQLKSPFLEHTGTISVRFSANTLEAYGVYLEKQCTLAKSRKINLAKAITTSLYIEKSLIENRFFEIFEGRSQEWTEVKRDLIAETRIHLAKMQQMAKENNLQ